MIDDVTRFTLRSLASSLAVPWLVSGRCLAVVWLLSGCCLAVPWLLLVVAFASEV